MTFLARLAQFLFWLLVVSWSVGLLRRVFAWMLRGAKPRAEEDAGQTTASQRLHRDPVCGTHVSEEISFPLREGGTTLHFCSAKCRDRYAGSQHFAANG
jgi:YHS domain-containing protein